MTYPSTNSVNHILSYCYDYTSGLLLSSTDENQQTTDYLYSDSLDRLTETDFPDGGQTTYCYKDSASDSCTDVTVVPAIKTTRKISSTQSTVSVKTMDGLGQTTGTSQWTSTNSSNAINTTITLDGMGNAYRIANPYVTTSDPTYGLTTYVHDPLGRLVNKQNPDSSNEWWCYNGSASISQPNCTYGHLGSITSGTWVDERDENSNNWQRTSDGLGRLVAVMEPDGSTTHGAPTRETDYKYDALNDLLRVDQWGGANGSTGDRVRIFAYDPLGRLTNACNPESISPTSSCTTSGTWSNSYSYDANGNVASDTDGRALTTNYSYDNLNRLQVRTNPSSTANACFWYDKSSVSTLPAGCPAVPSGISTGGYLVGRTAYEWTSDGLTATGYGYDLIGRTNNQSICTPSTCGHTSFGLAFQYDLAGDQTSYTNGFGYTTTLAYDAAHRLNQVTSTPSDANHPGTLWTANTYDAIGLTKATLGNGLVQIIIHDNRERVSSESFTNSSNQNVYSFSLGYFADSTIQAANDSANGNWTYTLDNLNRLHTASATSGPFSGTALQWTIDPWGNRNTQTVTAGSGPQPSFSSTTNNQISGYCYDNAGHLLDQGTCSMGTHQFTYDGAGRLISPDHGNTSYIYDAEGNRAAKQVGGVSTYEYLYDLNGHQITEMTNGGTGWTRGEVYAGQLHVATYYSATTFFAHTDWLGNERVHSKVDGTVKNSCTNLPFGDLQSCTSLVTPLNFTGKERDQESGNDYFGARYYASNMGRWLSPDLVNVTEERMMNPSSTLNKYAYAADNPLKYVDPDGQDITIFFENPSLTGPGHIMMMAYAPGLPRAAYRSIGPDHSHANRFLTGIGWGVPVTDRFDFENLKSADDIRKKYSSITIQTSPEITQQVVQMLLTQRVDAYHTYGESSACASSCAAILHQIEQFQDLQGGTQTPYAFFSDIYSKYGNGAAGNVGRDYTFKPGTNYGSYRPGWDEFDLLNLLINQNQPKPKPTRSCTIVVTPNGTSGDC